MLFATSDVRLAPERTQVAASSVRDHTIGWNDLSSELEQAKGRVVVLVDACHSGHLDQKLVIPNDSLASRLTRGGRAGVTVFAAAKGRQ